MTERCAAPSCADARINEDETDVDCGGPNCPACDTGKACVTNSGCMSQVCVQHACAAPSCDDFTRNGAETGVDCGGGCLGCAAGLPCTQGSDCASLVCTDSVCQAPSCDDGVRNGSEMGSDCGSNCKGCPSGTTCTSSADCASKACTVICESPLHVELFCNDRSPKSNSPQPFFKISNTGTVPFPLSSLSLRYYYTKEDPGIERYNCYTVTGGDCSLLNSAVFGSVVPKKSTADRYMELHFSSKASALGVGKSVEISGAFYVPSYMPFIQANDYSYSPNTDFLSAPQVTLYADGVLIWGTEP